MLSSKLSQLPISDSQTVTMHSEAPVLGELGLHQLSGQLLNEQDVESERWYDAQPEWPQESSNCLRGTLERWEEVASEALSSASRMFDSRFAANSGDAAQRALRGEKTIGDQIAAYTLAVQESPVHRLDELHNLLSFAKRRGRERRQALEAIKDLFVNNLLPDNRRLVSFYDRTFSCDRKELSKRHLAYALFESELKKLYRQFIQTLEDISTDNLRFNKQKAVRMIFELLVAKPENEKLLLSLLVNKLGDPDICVSSGAAHSLSELLTKHHPQMRAVVVREVEQLLLRPNITQRAQFYAVCFLNQVPFRKDDTELARTVVKMYMDLFVAFIAEKKKEIVLKEEKKLKTAARKKRRRKASKKPEKLCHEVTEETKNSRLMAALLLGVNRAFPYTKPEVDDCSYDQYMDPLFRVAHADSFSSALQALALLLQVSQAGSMQNDRLYCALYSRLVDASESSEKLQAVFLNLVFKAIRNDTNPKRIKAFVKRLLQSAMYGSSSFSGACIIVVSECLLKGHKGLLRSFVSLPEGDDDDELFVDIDKLGEIANIEPNSSGLNSAHEDVTETAVSSRMFDNSKKDVTKSAATAESEDKNSWDNTIHYDPRKREPRFAGAERSSLWEATTLCAHYHPSVAMFARSVCKDIKAAETTGDPLKDFSLIAFLDRFCYKKAKNRAGKSLYEMRSSRYRDNPVANSEEFRRLSATGNIHADDKFLARFFEENPTRVIDEHKDNRDFGDVDSEEEAYEQAIEEEMKRLGGSDAHPTSGLVYGADIDEEDEDELKAFEMAFKNDVADSDYSGDEELTSVGIDSIKANNTENDSQMSSDDDNEENIIKSKLENGQRRKHLKRSSGSAFAAAEDFEEEINQVSEAAAYNANHTRKRKPRRAQNPVQINKKRRRLITA